MALIRAVDKWDIERGNITTVATFYIRNALNDMINDARYKVISPYTLSRTAAEDLRKLKSVDSNDAYEIATRIKMKPKRVEIKDLAGQHTWADHITRTLAWLPRALLAAAGALLAATGALGCRGRSLWLPRALFWLPRALWLPRAHL